LLHCWYLGIDLGNRETQQNYLDELIWLMPTTIISDQIVTVTNVKRSPMEVLVLQTNFRADWRSVIDESNDAILVNSMGAIFPPL
jgi:hypothetical protein